MANRPKLPSRPRTVPPFCIEMLRSIFAGAAANLPLMIGSSCLSGHSTMRSRHSALSGARA
eukprot:3570108-Pyramimonas_sp.AAC.1